MTSPSPSHPILDCASAAAHEKALLRGEEEREWLAMRRAGEAIARQLEQDLAIVGVPLESARILVLAGKGHNAGDALLAAAQLVQRHRLTTVEVGWVFGARVLRPLAQRAWRELEQAAGGRVRIVRLEEVGRAYAIVLDGIFGFQYRPPLSDGVRAWLTRVRSVAATLRAAIDLPSGWDDPDAFQADVTYATGIVKAPVLQWPNAGRVRYLDLGFFGGDEPGLDRVLTPELLRPLRQLRSAQSDKRSYGHLYVVAGSRTYPGAALMTVLGALQAGAGLVTAFVPESVAAAFAAACPEAIWHGCDENHEGGLALDTSAVVRARLDRADALLLGPGLGREPETLALVTALVRESRVPLVLDADALHTQVVWSGSMPRVLTPHEGEYQRISGGASLRDFRPTPGTVTVLKGPVTRITDATTRVYHSLVGGPVLARGGSGDILAGVIGALLAQQPQEPLLAAARAVTWHGLAADRLARLHGETGVRTTHLLDHLGPVLRELA